MFDAMADVLTPQKDIICLTSICDPLTFGVCCLRDVEAQCDLSALPQRSTGTKFTVVLNNNPVIPEPHPTMSSSPKGLREVT